jgi:hypothetical protein
MEYTRHKVQDNRELLHGTGYREFKTMYPCTLEPVTGDW